MQRREARTVIVVPLERTICLAVMSADRVSIPLWRMRPAKALKTRPWACSKSLAMTRISLGASCVKLRGGRQFLRARSPGRRDHPARGLAKPVARYAVSRAARASWSIDRGRPTSASTSSREICRARVRFNVGFLGTLGQERGKALPPLSSAVNQVILTARTTVSSPTSRPIPAVRPSESRSLRLSRARSCWCQPSPCGGW
jgi:hypothetical protein